jgi:mRNA interferase RelE/StbE
MPYRIVYASEAVQDVRRLRPYDRTRVLDGIAQHVRHEPTRVSKSRIKAMIQPFRSRYRLRLDDFRAYDDVDATTRTVSVLRILARTTEPTPEAPP